MEQDEMKSGGGDGVEGVDIDFTTQVIPNRAKQEVAPAAPLPHFKGPEGGGLAAGNYSIRGKIGSGGMGIVYLAMDRRLGRYVAIKRLKPELINDLAVRRRFMHEAKAAAALNNVHIVHIYSIGEDADGPYIVMEYVESSLPQTDADGPCPPQTLENYVSLNGPFDLEDGVHFVLKIGHAVEAAHSAGVIHRDIKPSNILMDSAGEPKIVDFGLARFTHPGVMTSITAAGDKFISLGYGAPEQEADATKSDERVDVYGLGALLYFVLTGKNPRYFREEDLPAAVRAPICKALATDRDERYQTVAGMDAALKTMLAESKTERPTVRTTWRCKWCDTVNPLSTRFCGECGWDGRDQCRECGADQQVGIQFCGVCGANARDYENAATVLRKIKLAVESRQFEWAVNYSLQPLTFEPVGPTGRQVLDEIRTLGADSQKKLRRREQLREIITAEMNAENYERAQRFIEEYRALSYTKDGFEDDLKSIPEKLRRRDCLRISKAFASRDWDLGERLLVPLGEGDGGLHSEELSRLWNVLRKHRRRIFAARAVVVAIVLALAYVLLLPPMKALNIRGTQFALKPGARIMRVPKVGAAFSRYARIWGVSDFDMPASAAPAAVQAAFAPAPVTPSSATSAESETLAKLEEDFRRQMIDIDKELAEADRTWRDEYSRALEKLREEKRTAGEFDSWKVVNSEIARFGESGDLPPESAGGGNSPALAHIQSTFLMFRDRARAAAYRKQVAATRHHIDSLDNSVRDFTIKGEMAKAELFSKALNSVRSNPSYLSAENFVDNFDKRHPEGTISNIIGMYASSGPSSELQQLKLKFDESMSAAKNGLAESMSKWHDDYRQSLIALRNERQREGDFIGLQAASTELGRFDLDRTITADAASSESPYLTQLRSKFIAERSDMDGRNASAIADAAEQYDMGLAALASRYTKDGNLDAAALAVAERRSLEAMPEVVAARRRVLAASAPVVK